MNYIAVRNLKRESDSLYIDRSIAKTFNALIMLVKRWLHNRGCDSTELLSKVATALSKVYANKLTYSESNYGLFQVIISLSDDKKQYIVTFNYTVIGELTYREMTNENKDS